MSALTDDELALYAEMAPHPDLPPMARELLAARADVRRLETLERDWVFRNMGRRELAFEWDPVTDGTLREAIDKAERVAAIAAEDGGSE